MGRYVQARARAGVTQGGLDHRTGGPFTIRSGNVNSSERRVRISELRQYRMDGIEPQLDCLYLVAERIQEFDGFRITYHGYVRMPCSSA